MNAPYPLPVKCLIVGLQVKLGLMGEKGPGALSSYHVPSIVLGTKTRIHRILRCKTSPFCAHFLDEEGRCEAPRWCIRWVVVSTQIPPAGTSSLSMWPSKALLSYSWAPVTRGLHFLREVWGGFPHTGVQHLMPIEVWELD